MENLGQFYVRNGVGQRVPLSALTNFESRSGPEFTMRYNEYRSAQINGSAAPGYSSDQATAALEEVFKQTMLAKWASITWACPIKSRRHGKGFRLGDFGLSLLFVFLILAACTKLVPAIQRVAQYAGRGVSRLRRVVAPPGCA